MLVVPAATAYLLARRFINIMVIGALLGVVATVAGLYLSYHFNLPSGPAMSLTAIGIFTLSAMVRRRVTT